MTLSAYSACEPVLCSVLLLSGQCNVHVSYWDNTTVPNEYKSKACEVAEISFRVVKAKHCAASPMNCLLAASK